MTLNGCKVFRKRFLPVYNGCIEGFPESFIHGFVGITYCKMNPFLKYLLATLLAKELRFQSRWVGSCIQLLHFLDLTIW